MRKGLQYSKEIADIFITIDADLQDDPYAIIEMVEKYKQGNEIVYGVRNNRDSDPLLYKMCATAYYKILKLLDVKSVSNHSEFRLIDKSVVAEIVKRTESALYIRGICAQMNVKYDSIYYARKPRTKGKSKYNYKSLLDVAFDGVTQAGSRPLMSIFYTGLFILFIGILLIFTKRDVPNNGMYSVLCILAGINLLALSAIGQYIGRILIQVQNRPETEEEEILDTRKNKQ